MIDLAAKQYPGALKIAAGRRYDYHGDDRETFEKSKEIIPLSEYGEAGWRPSTTGACDFTHDAIVILGDATVLGKHKLVCAEPKCPVHGSRRSAGGPLKSAPGVMNEERRKQVEELWQRRTRHAARLALHTAVRAKQEKDADSYRNVPLEVLRFVVQQACNAIRPQQEGTLHLESIWKPSKKPNKSTSWYSHPLDSVIGTAQDRGTLLRLLIDTSIAQDVAGTFSNGKEITTVAKGYGLDLKIITAPVEKEWAEKKRISYAKRDARLAAEKNGAAKKVKAKAEKSIVKSGTCRHCGCTETTPCIGSGRACSWTDKTKTVCSSPKCLQAEAARKAEGKKKPTKKAPGTKGLAAGKQIPAKRADKKAPLHTNAKRRLQAKAKKG